MAKFIKFPACGTNGEVAVSCLNVDFIHEVHPAHTVHSTDWAIPENAVSAIYYTDCEGDGAIIFTTLDVNGMYGLLTGEAV